MNKINMRHRLRLQAETVRLLSSKDLHAANGGFTGRFECASNNAALGCPNTAFTFCITRCGTTGDLTNLCTIQ